MDRRLIDLLVGLVFGFPILKEIVEMFLMFDKERVEIVKHILHQRFEALTG
jgi:hypothetical protein